MSFWFLMDQQAQNNGSAEVYQGLSDTCKGTLNGYLACVNTKVQELRTSNSTYMPNLQDYTDKICPNCKGNTTDLLKNCKDSDVKANPRTANFLLQCKEDNGYCINQIYSSLGNDVVLKPFDCGNNCQKTFARYLVLSDLVNNNISDSNTTWKKADVKKCGQDAAAQEQSDGFITNAKLHLFIGFLLLLGL